MTSQVNFQATGFVILFAAARKGAGKEFLFPEVGTVMGKQSTHRDKGLLAAWTKKTQACSLVWQKSQNTTTQVTTQDTSHWSKQGRKWFRSTSGKLRPLTSGFVIAKVGVTKGSQQAQKGHLFWCDLEMKDLIKGKVLQSQPSAPSSAAQTLHTFELNVNPAHVRPKKTQWKKWYTKEQDFC